MRVNVGGDAISTCILHSASQATCVCLTPAANITWSFLLVWCCWYVAVEESVLVVDGSSKCTTAVFVRQGDNEKKGKVQKLV